MKLIFILALFIITNANLFAWSLNFTNKATMIMPHEAQYDVFLKGFNTKIGTMSYRINNKCSRYTAFNKWDLDMPDIGKLIISQSFKEDIKSLSSVYKSVTLIANNDKVIERKSVEVIKEDGHIFSHINDNASASINKLNDDVMFPIQLQTQILQAISKNKTSLNAIAFDGSDIKPKMVNTLILNEGNSNTLKSEYFRKKPIRISQSFYEIDSTDSSPIATIFFDLYEKGFTDNIAMQFGEYKFIAKMTGVSSIATESCPR